MSRIHLALPYPDAASESVPVRAGRGSRKATCCGSSGQASAEFVILIIVVAIGVFLAIRYFGSSVQGEFDEASQQIADLQEAAGGESDGGAPSGGSGAGGAGSSVGEGSGPVLSRDSDHDAFPSEDDSGSSRSVSRAGESNSADKSAAGKRGSSQGAIDPEDQQVNELKSSGVGIEENDPAGGISVHLWTLLGIALLIGVVGFVVIFGLGEDAEGAGDKKKNKKKKKKKKKKGKLTDTDENEGGQALVEFTFIAITFFVVLLGVLQMALYLNAASLVRYAAYNAARAAIVHGGDEEKMLEAVRVSLAPVFPSHGRADTVLGMMENIRGARQIDQIRAHADWNEPITEVKIINNNSYGAGSVTTFDDPQAGSKAVVTVGVRHNYELVIPIVNAMAYKLYRFWRGGDKSARDLNKLAADAQEDRSYFSFARRSGYRIPITEFYSMRLQSDYVR